MIDISTRHRDFPSLDDVAYLATAAEGLPPIHVGSALNEYWEHKCQGLSGRAAMQQRLQATLELAAKFIGLSPAEVAIASSCSEAYNLLNTCLDLKPNDEVVVTNLDFPSGVTPWLTSKLKPSVHVWHHRNGGLEIMDLLPILSSRTRLVQLPLISPHNGFHLPWRSIADKVRKLAPQAIIALDITQALGRISVRHCADADIIISAAHTWALGVHGAALVAVPQTSAEKLTTRAGGWRHLKTPFDLAQSNATFVQHGAAGFGVGTPGYGAVYALHAGLSYLDEVGIDGLVTATDPLVEYLHESLITLGLQPLATIDQDLRPTGIVAFQHADARSIHAALIQRGVEIQRQGTTIRASIHGYTTDEDINRMLTVLDRVLP
jgi:cysteine desulfurase / selenocysteine lyase